MQSNELYVWDSKDCRHREIEPSALKTGRQTVTRALFKARASNALLQINLLLDGLKGKREEAPEQVAKCKSADAL